MKLRSWVICEDALQTSLYWELEVILWCRYFFFVFKRIDENLEVFWIVMPLTLTWAVRPTGAAVRDPAEGGGPSTRLPVSTGQPAGHVQFSAAPRGREGAHLPGGEGQKSDWIHPHLQ